MQLTLNFVILILFVSSINSKQIQILRFDIPKAKLKCGHIIGLTSLLNHFEP